MSFDLAWTLRWNQRGSSLDDFKMKHLDLPFSFRFLLEYSFVAASTRHHFCFPVLLLNQHLRVEIHTHSNGRRPFLSPFWCPILFHKPDRFYPATAPASQLTTFHAFCLSADRSNPVLRSVSIGSWKGYFWRWSDPYFFSLFRKWPRQPFLGSLVDLSFSISPSLYFDQSQLGSCTSQGTPCPVWHASLS